MPLNPDDTLLNGQYRILRLLGRGGFGFVCEAQPVVELERLGGAVLARAFRGES